ncbi:MAG: iron uptake porin [Synechococcaceae cyanobacterium]
MIVRRIPALAASLALGSLAQASLVLLTGAQAADAAPAAATAAVAASTASLDLESIRRYSEASIADDADVGAEQVTSIDQFADVKPTDWAYQALSNLIERYGCVAGYPDGSFRGGRPLSRYEAAALLNACLDRISEVTDELKRLMKEFEKELALLRGRVDGLEAKVAELEATQFSTTTRLRGDTHWVLGGLDYSGNTIGNPIYTDPGAKGYTPLKEALTFNYDVRLFFDTSFTGKDLLRTTLRAGNFADSGFGALPTPLTRLDAQFQEDCGTDADCGDVVAINRLFYQFPIGSSLTATIGGRVRQDDMLAVWPSVYTNAAILKIFQYAGAPGAYSQVLGAGGGLWWKQAGRSTGWSLSANYVSANGDGGDPSEGGIATSGAAATGTVQLAYTGSNWNLSAAYTRSGPNVSFPGTPLSVDILPRRGLNNGYTQSVGLSGYWQPSSSGWLPSVSAGWGLNRIYYTDTDTLVPSDERGYRAASESWYVGVVWNDVLFSGNALGAAFGMPTKTTNSDGDTVCKVWFPPSCSGSAGVPDGNFHNPDDANYALEVYYKMQVTDQISITPGIFWLSRPLGQYTINYGPGTDNNGTLSTLGYVVQAAFQF